MLLLDFVFSGCHNTDLELGNWKFLSVGDLSTVLKNRFGGEDDRSTKIAELK